ncbi:hypothetical protein KKA24_02865 [Patescibacteria group bacterium]|nr:hypothetical protein [Patescibacteria group bacterium]
MKKTILTILLLFILLAPVSVLAGVVPCGLVKDDPELNGDQTVPCTLCHLFVLGDNIVTFLLKDVVPALAAFIVVIGGVMIMLSYSGGMVDAGGGKKGGPALLGQAKKLLISLAIGLVIIYGAWIFVSLFLDTIIGVKDWAGLKNGGWSTINCPTP